MSLARPLPALVPLLLGGCGGVAGFGPLALDGEAGEARGCPDGEEPVTVYLDADDDGFGDAATAREACAPGPGEVLLAGDCDDSTGRVSPDADETCGNEVDEDCDGEIDEDDASDASAWFVDADGDGHGDPDSVVWACEAPPDRVARAGDCDDADPAVSPEAVDACNGIDDDCDGQVDRFRVPTDYRSLQEAVDALSDGQEICLEPGNHTDSLDVSNRTFTVTGVGGRDLTFLDLAGTETPFLTADGAYSDLTLRGLTVTGLDTGAAEGADLEGAFAWVRRGRLRLEDVAIVDHRLTLTDDGNDLRGGLIYSERGTVELEDVAVSGLSLRYLEGDRAGSPDLEGGLLFASGGVVSLRGVDITDVTVSTAAGVSDCHTDGALLHTEDAAVTLVEVAVSELSIEQECEVAAYARGAVAWLDAGSLEAEDLRFEQIEVQTAGRLAYVYGLVRGFGLTGHIAEVDISGASLSAASEANAYASGGFTLFGSRGISVQGYRVWDSAVAATDLAGLGGTGEVEGGALYVSGQAELLHIDLRGATARGDARVRGGGAWLSAAGSELDVRNLVAAGNRAGLSATSLACGGGLYVDPDGGSVRLSQLDLVGNEVRGAEVGGGGICVAADRDEGSVEVVNSGVVGSVLAGTTSAEGAAVAAGGEEGARAQVSWRYSNAWANTGAEAFALPDEAEVDEGNVSVDPLYVDRGAISAVDWDLTLDGASPLVDAGSPDLQDVDGTVSDVGAYGGQEGDW